MKSIADILDPIKTALVSVCGTNCYHYWRTGITSGMLIWAEDGADSGDNLDNIKGEQRVHGSCDYFTSSENDTTVDSIQLALNSVENCVWNLESIQYEEETKLIHYEWYWTVM